MVKSGNLPVLRGGLNVLTTRHKEDAIKCYNKYFQVVMDGLTGKMKEEVRVYDVKKKKYVLKKIAIGSAERFKWAKLFKEGWVDKHIGDVKQKKDVGDDEFHAKALTQAVKELGRLAEARQKEALDITPGENT